MLRSDILRFIGVFAFCLVAVPARSAESAEGTTDTIFGIVQELRSGTPDVPVCLCDATTGMPLTQKNYEPIDWMKFHADATATEMAIVLSDDKGKFQFENVPAGKYRLIAQKWIGPYKGVFEVHGTVIQLLGVAEDVIVPRPTDDSQAQVVLRPPGSGIVQFDQDVGNNETFMFLSTAPTEFDPILGLNAMGPSFLQRLIGVNRMPLGKTTVIGVPDQLVYAFFFAPDNSPGYATVEVPKSEAGLVRVPPQPFVAGWSNGRKIPPPELAELGKFMDEHTLTPLQLLNIPEFSNATSKKYYARLKELSQQLSRDVELTEGKSARVGDILAVEWYRQLKD